MVVAETAWLAEDLNIPMWSVAVTSTPAYQRRYVERLFEAAQALEAEALVWWCPVDFDALWETILNRDPLASIWRDTGLYDRDLVTRPALSVWEQWRQRSREAPQ